MKAIIVALTLVAIALTFERLYLRWQRKRLRVTEQSFTFHKLRDELQLLAVDGQIEVDSHLYGFLSVMLNLGIRNAGTLRASQVVQMAKTRTHEFDDDSNDSLVRHVKMYNPQVQHFVGKCFYEFSRMLVLNDPLYSTWRFLSEGVKSFIRQTLARRQSYLMLLQSIYLLPPLQSLFPQQAAMIKTASEYRAIGDDLCLI